MFTEAFALHQAGRLAEAEKAYAQVLLQEPGHFDALHLRGLILHQRGDHAGALSDIDAALQQAPDNLVALSNRGLVLNALGRFDDALASYARALARSRTWAGDAAVECGADPAPSGGASQQSARLTASSRGGRLLIISAPHRLSRFPRCILY